MARHRVDSIDKIRQRLRHDRVFFNLLISELSVTVTEMFRQPSLFHLLRKKILPTLTNKSGLKIWSAGCASGEETYSLAILLHEAGLLERTQLYATDINPIALETAVKGILPLNKLKQYVANYQQSGGKEDFCNYYSARHNVAFMEPFLKDSILFTQHNLAHDQAFGEMDIILCRNVLIYFTPRLQDRVVELFLNSLTGSGFLCLGDKESIYLTGHHNRFSPVVGDEKLYQKNSTQREHHYVAG